MPATLVSQKFKRIAEIGERVSEVANIHGRWPCELRLKIIFLADFGVKLATVIECMHERVLPQPPALVPSTFLRVVAASSRVEWLQVRNCLSI